VEYLAARSLSAVWFNNNGRAAVELHHWAQIAERDGGQESFVFCPANDHLAAGSSKMVIRAFDSVEIDEESGLPVPRTEHQQVPWAQRESDLLSIEETNAHV